MKATLRAFCLLAACAVVPPALAADLRNVDRTIKKEPSYQSKPKYCLLVFGPEAKDRVWLVHDGDSLYVDRNGDGDLTDPGEKVSAKVDKDRNPDNVSQQFEAGELRVGERVHRGLHVYASPITEWSREVRDQPNAKAALAVDSKAIAYTIGLDVEMPGLKGKGVGERTVWSAGPLDSQGALLFADKPTDAPIIHFDGALQVTLYGGKPVLKLTRSKEIMLVVGTPGRSAGTFAMLHYGQTIPETAIPVLQIAFPAAEKRAGPVGERFELKQRC